jgi:hypothetical protein
MGLLAKARHGLAFLIGLSVVIMGPASAQSTLSPQDNVLIGTWREQLRLGSMVVQFTASTMSFTSADGTGQLIPNSTHLAHVHYLKLDKSIGIDFDEQGGGGIIATPQDATHVVLDFPGAGAHRLEKVQ